VERKTVCRNKYGVGSYLLINILVGSMKRIRDIKAIVNRCSAYYEALWVQ